MRPDSLKSLLRTGTGNGHRRVYVHVATFLVTAVITALSVVAISLVAAILPIIPAPVLCALGSLALVLAAAGASLVIGRIRSKYKDKLSPIMIACVPIYAAVSCCCLYGGLYGYLAYKSKTFPSPAPYPGAMAEEIWRDVGHGRYGTTVFEYVVEVPLDEVERYYEAEMERYCADGWQFMDTELVCPDYPTCRVAECEIPRPFVKDAQFFSVYLWSTSVTHTNVRYYQKTANP
jgi:hypothetical protein